MSEPRRRHGSGPPLALIPRQALAARLPREQHHRASRLAVAAITSQGDDDAAHLDPLCQP
eukprot:3370808-Heterocapsa_arctica.AAC.1